MLGRENVAKTWIWATERASKDCLSFNSRRKHSYISNIILFGYSKHRGTLLYRFSRISQVGRENWPKRVVKASCIKNSDLGPPPLRRRLPPWSIYNCSGDDGIVYHQDFPQSRPCRRLRRVFISFTFWPVHSEVHLASLRMYPPLPLFPSPCPHFFPILVSLS